MSVIETSGLTKRFGEDVLAVDGLSLSVDEGEVFGFLGPNGAGKSTTINTLLGFLQPTSGSASVLGHDVETESRAIRQRLGVLPEGFEVYDRLTGVEHVSFAVDLKDASDDPDAILDRVGLDPEDRTRPAGDYSKGMQQRLALGMALVGDPDLLILDEPSSGLDPTGMQEIRAIVREEAASGTTVFFSSHILPEVQEVCDRVGIMNQGQLVAVDTIEALRDLSGGPATIELELASVPDDLALERVEGVQHVAVTDDTVSVDCADESHKVDVVQHVAQRADVLDIVSEDTSLEELFNAYTSPGDASVEAEPADDDDPREPQEVVA